MSTTIGFKLRLVKDETPVSNPEQTPANSIELPSITEDRGSVLRAAVASAEFEMGGSSIKCLVPDYSKSIDEYFLISKTNTGGFEITISNEVSARSGSTTTLRLFNPDDSELRATFNIRGEIEGVFRGAEPSNDADNIISKIDQLLRRRIIQLQENILHNDPVPREILKK